jgi:hypothetical protein
VIEFTQALSETGLSQFIQTTLWVIPWVQIVHILAIAVVLSSIFMIDMRILNLTGRSQTMTQTAQRFAPWIWWGLLVLLITGTILIIGEPKRSLNNVAFWIKMGLLAVAIASTIAFQLSLRGRMAFWEEDAEGRMAVRILAIGSFLVWCGIAMAGRWIAYVS